MQLYVLNQTDYYPKHLVEGYSSLIWTEKFLDPGETIIDSANVDTIRSIPPGTLLAIAGSQEVMLVETHNTGENEQGYPTTKISGRTVDCVLDDRLIWGPHATALTLPRTYSYRDAALMYMWSSVVNTLAADVANTTPRPAALYQHSPVPKVIVTDSTAGSAGAEVKFSVNMGPAGPSIRDFLSRSALGIRTIRPNSPGPANVIMVITTNGANKGLVTKTLESNFTELRLDVYVGTDRSKNQTAVPAVTFLGSAGQITGVEILESDKDFSTDLILTTDAATTYNSSTPYSPPANGFSRRIRYVDGSPLIEGVAPADHAVVVDAFTQQYYAQHSGQGILDGDVSAVAAYKYGEDYFMGDILTLVYAGFEKDVRVNEYTRVEDRNGERQYPTFLTVPS